MVTSFERIYSRNAQGSFCINVHLHANAKHKCPPPKHISTNVSGTQKCPVPTSEPFYTNVRLSMFGIKIVSFLHVDIQVACTSEGLCWSSGTSWYQTRKGAYLFRVPITIPEMILQGLLFVNPPFPQPVQTEFFLERNLCVWL